VALRSSSITGSSSKCNMSEMQAGGFPAGKGQPNDPKLPVTSLKTAWTKVRDKAKVVWRWHDSRHTLVTELSESGAGDEVIMEYRWARLPCHAVAVLPCAHGGEAARAGRDRYARANGRREAQRGSRSAGTGGGRGFFNQSQWSSNPRTWRSTPSWLLGIVSLVAIQAGVTRFMAGDHSDLDMLLRTNRHEHSVTADIKLRIPVSQNTDCAFDLLVARKLGRT
jgi:hypothetical protein